MSIGRGAGTQVPAPAIDEADDADETL